MDTRLVTSRGEVGHQQSTLDLRMLPLHRGAAAILSPLATRPREDRSLLRRRAGSTHHDLVDPLVEHTREVLDGPQDTFVPWFGWRRPRGH